MQEVGIDVKHHTVKQLDDSLMNYADVFVNICQPGKSSCPLPPTGVRFVTWEIPGPAFFSEDHEQAMRMVRDEIEKYVKTLLDDLLKQSS
jgi:arsenate reductase